ncbi:nuclear protein [Plasmodium ovale curtisi]|uniref:Nuclear protein n=1 Tax=Plasmodium ovale curtisi TaxID=864141 RepID=A0A1A8X0V2_PLAOA|nr:nuclear protein [Plasmodium ovale curtisi]
MSRHFPSENRQKRGSMPVNDSNKSNEIVTKEEREETDSMMRESCDDNNSTNENEERNTLIQVLHSYEDFQRKNNTSYGKTNPYKKKETQIGRIRKTLIKLFSISDLRIDQKENNFLNSSNGCIDHGRGKRKKRKGEEQNGRASFLTSRAAMWREVEKNDDPDYDLKLESSKNKSFLEITMKYVNLLLNDALNDKKGMTFIAGVVIILSVIITCVSGLITLFSTNITEQGKWNSNQSRSNYGDINKFMNYIKMGSEDGNGTRIQELLYQLRDKIEENTRVGDADRMGEKTHLDGITSSGYSHRGGGTLFELNVSVEKSLNRFEKSINKLELRLREVESALTTTSEGMDNLKTNSNKEVEIVKKKLQENYETMQNIFKDYVKTIDGIKNEMNRRKNTIFNDVDKKITKSHMDMKKDVSSKVESEKKELVQMINEMQKKVEWIEVGLVKLTGQTYEGNFTEDEPLCGGGKIRGSYRSAIWENTYEKGENAYNGTGKDSLVEGSGEMGTSPEWITNHVHIVKELKRELDSLRESMKKSSDFVDDVFPSFEEKMLKNMENKIKYYLEIYKKDIMNEITESKVIYNEEKYRTIMLKQEKSQSELLKTIHNQIKIQTKLMKEDLNKSLGAAIEKKQFKGDTEYVSIPKISKSHYDSLESLQNKVDELYNEVILDYNQIDWALESLGARIVYKMTSSPLNQNDFIERFLNQIASFLPSEEIYGMIKPMGKDPSIILKPANFPGDCFSFNGNKGNITIHLPATIDVTSISIQHVHENISNNPNATPKYFSVYGIVDLNWPENFETNDINYDDFKNSSLYSCMHSIYGNLEAKDILEKWLQSGKDPRRIHIGDFYFDRKKRISTYPTKHCFPVKRASSNNAAYTAPTQHIHHISPILAESFSNLRRITALPTLVSIG